MIQLFAFVLGIAGPLSWFFGMQFRYRHQRHNQLFHCLLCGEFHRSYQLPKTAPWCPHCAMKTCSPFYPHETQIKKPDAWMDLCDDHPKLSVWKSWRYTRKFNQMQNSPHYQNLFVGKNQITVDDIRKMHE